MAQDSIPQLGSTVGHALSTDVWSAPYSDAEWADLWYKLHGSQSGRGYVVPGYLNGLAITESAVPDMGVLVDSGAAFVAGRLYELTAQAAVSLSAADGSNPRIDVIVLAYNATANTITLGVVDGTAAATPSVPALTQSASIYQVALAYIWVATSTTTIVDEDIDDQRKFAVNFEGMLSSILQNNLLRNSEFMADSQLGTVVTSSGSPDAWHYSGSVTASHTADTKPDQMSRGRAVVLTLQGSNAGIAQLISVKPSTTYTIKGLIKVTAGDVGYISISDDGGGTTKVRHIRRTGAWYEIVLRYTTGATATLGTLVIGGVTNTDVITIGQWLVVEGYEAGPFRAIHETILFRTPLGDASWAQTAKSSGTTTIDLDSSFEGIILPGTVAVYMQASSRDSGSAASQNCLLVVMPRGQSGSYAWIKSATGGLTNDYLRWEHGWVPVDQSMQFDVVVTATGAGTLDAELEIMGIIT